MEIDTRQLILLEALGSGDSLTTAAERLFVSQSALSQRLSGLERQLGMPLFERNGRTLVPNDAGQRMIAAARSVLMELRGAQHDVEQMAKGAPDVLRIASQCSVNFQWLPPVLSAFGKRFPGTEVRIESTLGERPLLALLQDQIDVAVFTKQDALAEQVVTCELFRDEMVAMVSMDHPWAKRAYVTAKDFHDVHLIVHDAYDPARYPPAPLPIPAGAQPRKVTPMPLLPDLVAQLVASGDSVAVLPNWTITDHMRSRGVTTTSLTRATTTRAWFRAHRPGDDRAHVMAFLGEMDAVFKEGVFPRIATA